MDFLDDPGVMTPEQRLTEIASILAAGYLRLKGCGHQLANDAIPPSVHRESPGLFCRKETLVCRGVDGRRVRARGGRAMKQAITRQIEGLRDLTVVELRERYQEVFGDETRSSHKTFLYKRITWGLQDREGDSDLRLLAPKHTVVGNFKPSRDRRVPMPGTMLTREYRGQTVAVTVLDVGFEYQGAVYRSLTAVARAVTGSRWNGMLFFGLTGKGAKQ
jgi:hypothetical protein